jgi:hypothetical protein
MAVLIASSPITSAEIRKTTTHSIEEIPKNKPSARTPMNATT